MKTIKAIIRPKINVKRCLFDNEAVKKILFQLQEGIIYLIRFFPHAHMSTVA